MLAYYLEFLVEHIPHESQSVFAVVVKHVAVYFIFVYALGLVKADEGTIRESLYGCLVLSISFIKDREFQSHFKKGKFVTEPKVGFGDQSFFILAIPL